MQQYFINEKLNINSSIQLEQDILHHIKNVLRKHNGYQFRLIDQLGRCFIGELKDNTAIIRSEIESNNELPINVTVIMSLIKNEKFDLTLQKLTELGVKRIVPFSALRSVIKIKDEQKKLERYRKIVQEASEQCHRTCVPEIPEIVDLKSLIKYKSVFNYVAYEKETSNPMPFKMIDDDVTIVIGPEGGFDISEIEFLEKNGFQCKTLGKRILRAETAAMFVMSNFVGVNEL